MCLGLKNCHVWSKRGPIKIVCLYIWQIYLHDTKSWLGFFCQIHQSSPHDLCSLETNDFKASTYRKWSMTVWQSSVDLWRWSSATFSLMSLVAETEWSPLPLTWHDRYTWPWPWHLSKNPKNNSYQYMQLATLAKQEIKCMTPGEQKLDLNYGKYGPLCRWLGTNMMLMRQGSYLNVIWKSNEWVIIICLLDPALLYRSKIHKIPPIDIGGKDLFDAKTYFKTYYPTNSILSLNL